jgi:hypothetical protein
LVFRFVNVHINMFKLVSKGVEEKEEEEEEEERDVARKSI